MRVGYKALRMIDGRRTEPHSRSILIIDGDKIEGIIPEAEVSKDLKIVELGDATLLPGLIDSHVHLVDDGSALPRNLVENESHGLTLLRSAKRAFDGLLSGITTVRDMGAPSGIIPTLKDAVNLGVVRGPTIVTCDTQLTITGGYGRKENVLGREVDGADAMRKVVREVFKRGGDFIKIMASGKVSVAGSAPEAAQFTQEEMNAAVEEAHRFGRKVSVHAIGLKAIESSVSAGVDSIEHGNFLTEELAEEMAKKGIYLIPVLVPFYVLAHPPQELVLPREVKTKAENAWRVTLDAVRLAKKIGVKIGAGTDSGGPCIPHNSVVKELQLLISTGFSPMEAIISATQINAEIVERSEFGSLEKGKLADVIAVDGNPLEDIEAFSNVKLVLKNGHEILRNSQLFG